MKKKIETPRIEDQVGAKVEYYFRRAGQLTRDPMAQSVLAQTMVQYEVHLENKAAKENE